MSLEDLAEFETATMISELRVRLKDNHPNTTKRRFTDAELQVYLQNALWDINACPPGQSYFFLEDWALSVPEWKSLIIEGGMIFALIAQGIFQIGLEFSYSDNGISLTMDRSQKYSSFAQMLMANYQNMKILIKKNYWMKSLNTRTILSPDMAMRIRTYAPSQYRIR